LKSQSIGEELTMTESKTITFPKTVPLIERIEGVSKEISKWLESLEEPFDMDRDTMHLVKAERNDHYSYHYILDRAVKGPEKKSASHKSKQG